MSALGDILSAQGDTAKQFFLWGVLYAIINQAAAPYMRDVAYLTNDIDPNMVLSPPDLADAVVRGIKTQADGAAEAKKSGFDAAHFDELVKITGDPPALQLLFEMIRRGVIDETLLEKGVREGRVKDEWIPYVKEMQYAIPTPTDFVRAAVQNQLTYDQASQAAKIAGLSPAETRTGNIDFFKVLFDTAGRPPGPVELAEMVHRGVIPWTGVGPGVLSFEQGVSESDVKDKWTAALQAASEYLPPPRTTTALLKEGAIDDNEAAQLFQKAGLNAHLSAVYVAAAHHQKVAVEKDLAKADVLKLYESHAIDGAQATTMLAPLGYTGAVAAFILQLADMRREITALEQAISRVRSFYVARKIPKKTASDALDALGVVPAERDQLLTTWELEANALVRLPTPAQIEDAFAYTIINQDQAITDLQALGYSAHDAWLVLSVKNKAALPNEPARGASEILPF